MQAITTVDNPGDYIHGAKPTKMRISTYIRATRLDMPKTAYERTRAALIEVRPKYNNCADVRSLTLRQGAIYPTNSLNFLKNAHGRNGAHEASNDQSRSDNVSIPLKLNVIIVGAGLGGLATAVALRLHGHQVTVLEQASALAEASIDQNQASCWHIFQRLLTDSDPGRRWNTDPAQLESNFARLGPWAAPGRGRSTARRNDHPPVGRWKSYRIHRRRSQVSVDVPWTVLCDP